MMARRAWKTGVSVFAALAIGAFALLSPATAAPVAGGTLDPTTVPKYVTPLVIPPQMPASTISPAPAAKYDIAVRQFKQQILPGGIWNTLNGRTDAFGPTTVWSYGRAQDPLPDSTALGGGAGVAPAPNSTFNYPAFTVENFSNTATTVRWINDLKDPATGNFLPHMFSVDQTLHWANPTGTGCMMPSPTGTDCMTMNPAPYTGPVPLVTHVHGAHVNPDSDGYPESWWLPGANNIPAGYVATGSNYTQANAANTVPGSAYYGYANTQPAGTLWYHDHALGMTRLNVYAGPAGFWLIRGGANDTGAGVLPGPAPGLNADGTPQDVNGLTAASVRNQIREIPIAIQDRSFNYDPATGATALFYPANRAFFEGLNLPGGSQQFPGAGVLNIPFIDPTMMSDISPIWNPEVFFNTMVVNGSTWPKLDVAPERYRLRLLNGCNSRTLNLAIFVVTGPGLDGIYGTADDVLGAEIPFYQIGAEQGFLPKVVMIRTGFATPLPGTGTIPAELPLPDPAQALLMGLAERADVIVDFTGLANGTRVRIVNTGPDFPFGGFVGNIPADPGTTGQVMEFVVNTAIPAGAASTPPQNLILPAEGALGVASNTRQVSLNEMMSDQVCVEADPITGAFVGFLFNTMPNDPNFMANCAAHPVVVPGDIAVQFAPRQALLGTVTAGVATPKKWADPITETPQLNSTEVWEIFNTTVDAHPIHLHLVRFQVVERQAFDPLTLAPLAGTVTPPLPGETGYKDTIISPPGQITRIKARFDIPGLYVWHCHIVEHEDNEMMRPYKVIGPPTAVGLSSLPVSPTIIGTPVQFTAAANGGSGPYEYQFLLTAPGGAPQTVQAYSTAAVWNWITTGLAAGTYQVTVQARNVGSAAAFEATQSLNHNLVTTLPPATAVALSGSPANLALIGTTAQFTAAASGGSGTYEYQFYLKAPGGAYLIVQNYSTAAVWNWNTSGLAAGTYQVKVLARSLGSTALYEAARSIYYNLIVVAPAAGVTLTGSPAYKATSGTPVQFTAAASGGSGTYEYQFYLKAPGGAYLSVQNYSTAAVWSWNTSGLAAGTYQVKVLVRNLGSAASYEAGSSIYYSLVISLPPAPTPATAVSLTGSPVRLTTIGTPVKFTALASGGSGTYEYKFSLQAPGGAYLTVQNYSTAAVWNWNTSGLAAGTYQVKVVARSLGSTASYEAARSTYYDLVVLPPATGVSLTGNPAYQATSGTPVQFTAAGTGGSGTYEYKFLLRAPGGALLTVQNYSTAAAWNWNTNGLTAGTYKVEVRTRNLGSAASYEAARSMSYVLK